MTWQYSAGHLVEETGQPSIAEHRSSVAPQSSPRRTSACHINKALKGDVADKFSGSINIIRYYRDTTGVMRIKLASIAVLTAVFVSFISPLMAQVSPPEVATPPLPELTPDLLAKSQLGAQWMAAFALLMGAIAAVAGIDRYLKTKQWQRRELARTVVADIKRKRDIRNITEIIDFEE